MNEPVEPVIEQPIVETQADKPEPSLREQIESAQTEAIAKADRARDEAGRFAKGEQERQAKPEVVKPVADKPVVQATDKPAEQPTEQQPERPTLAPSSWSAAAKAAWVNADPTIKAEIARREAQVHKEFTKQDAERNLGLQFRKVIEPNMAMIQADGGDPVKGFQNYLNTAKILRTGDPQVKAQLVRQMCQQFNIQLEQVQAAPDIDTRQQSMYTRAQQLEQENQLLQAQIQEIPLKSQIEAFAADPAHEYYEAVRPVMAALLQSGQAQTLQEAYDQAIWARPDIRSTLTAQQIATGQEKRVAEAKAKADAARRASGSVIGSPGRGTSADPQAGNRTLRQELEANFASARV